MDVVQHNQNSFGDVKGFELHASYVEVKRDSPNNRFGSHVHPECEIYINLSGNVSFMVENRIYPIMPGNIVITRPYEYHHCIYHDNEPHKHFWILFSSQENERLLDRFFARKVGEGNLLKLSGERLRELETVCHALCQGNCSEGKRYYLFFWLIHLLELAELSKVLAEKHLPDVAAALDYIEQRYHMPLTVAEIAEAVHVSVNTLERHFDEMLHMSPSVYLKKKRLGIAAELLYRGETVSEACRKSGFGDYSGFIALFRKTYGTTPLQYQKQNRSNKTQP